MRYYQTAGGHCYKEYVNGRKCRISRKEYQKKGGVNNNNWVIIPKNNSNNNWVIVPKNNNSNKKYFAKVAQRSLSPNTLRNVQAKSSGIKYSVNSSGKVKIIR